MSYTPFKRDAPAVSHLVNLRDYITRLKGHQKVMDPLITSGQDTLDIVQQLQSKSFIDSAKRTMATNDQIQNLDIALKITMSDEQRKEWAILVNSAEEEWMSTVECVRKLQLRLDRVRELFERRK